VLGLRKQKGFVVVIMFKFLNQFLDVFLPKNFFKFTLPALIKGNKLDFHRSMNPENAPQFYKKYFEKLQSKYISEKIKDGKFGSLMSIKIENDGPVTINLDSKDREN
jgi:hypothetical protein